MKKLPVAVCLALVLLVSACKKTGTLTVTVNKQSVGQPAQLAIGVAVVAQSISNSSKIFEAQTSGGGVAAFNDIPQDSYKVTSEVWDGSAYLRDDDIIDVKSGKNTDVILLLQ